MIESRRATHDASRISRSASGRRGCRRAVFLDRDGVIIAEAGYISRPGQMRLLAAAARGIKRLNRAGFKVIVVTNQSAIGRGIVSRGGLGRLHLDLRRRLARRGAKLDAIYHCPHLPPEAGGPRCACRKPGTALLRRAARRFRLRLADCYMVGDSTSDLQAGRNAGCVPLLVRTGKKGRDGLFSARPKRAFRNLDGAAKWICDQATGEDRQ